MMIRTKVIKHGPFRMGRVWVLGLCLMLLSAWVQAGDMPLLRLNPDMHTASIRRVDVDKRERYAVTASHDKSVIVWDLDTGALLRRLRLPAARGHVGKANAVALSPDGERIAVGGYTGKYGHNFIYIYGRQDGTLVQSISGLEQVIHHLAFSPDGRLLAATLGGPNGLRIYDTTTYQEVYADRGYGKDSYGASWQGNAGLVTGSYDGTVRFYTLSPSGWTLSQSRGTGKDPYGVAVHPNGSRVAVGFRGTPGIGVYSLPGLTALPGPDTQAFDNGDLSSVCWSQQGDWLWAGGAYDENHYSPIIGFGKGLARLVTYPVTTDVITNLYALADGDLLVASADGLIRLSDRGDIRWQQRQSLVDFRGQYAKASIRLSTDGRQVSFGFKLWGKDPAWWDMWQFALIASPQAPPAWNADLLGAETGEYESITVRDWDSTIHPTLNGHPIRLEEFERSRCLALFPDHHRFILGTAWYLRCFSASGKQIWRQSVPEVVWALCVSGDGRWVVAGLGDGTLRWYDAKTGEEHLALFVHAETKEWIIWTPEGFFAGSSPSANRLFGYQLNNGNHKAPDFITADQLYLVFGRKDLVWAKFQGNTAAIAQALAGIGDVREVLKAKPPMIALDPSVNTVITGTHFTLPLNITDQGGGIGDLVVKVNGTPQRTKGLATQHHSGIRYLDLIVPPAMDTTVEVSAPDAKGLVYSAPLTVQVTSSAPPSTRKPNLRGLAIGIETYRESAFNLRYAIDDVKDFKKILKKHGKRLYGRVDIDLLPDATYEDIMDAFKTATEEVNEDDVFVLYLSGHGVTRNGNYYFLTRNFTWTSPDALEKNTIDSQQLNTFFSGIKARKAVMFLDTCYAGSYRPDITSHMALQLASRGAGEDKMAVSLMIEEQSAVDRLNQLSGRAVFYASTDRQQALEGYGNHGLYTALVLEGLKGAASHDNAFVSLHELSSYLETEVPKASKKKFNVTLYPMAHVPTSFDFTSE